MHKICEISKQIVKFKYSIAATTVLVVDHLEPVGPGCVDLTNEPIKSDAF